MKTNKLFKILGMNLQKNKGKRYCFRDFLIINIDYLKTTILQKGKIKIDYKYYNSIYTFITNGITKITCHE